jgi:glycosyltransferase involved in cell wall biosynthesis
MTRMRTLSASGRPHVVILGENLPVPLDRRIWLEARTLADAGYGVTVISPKGRGDMARRREVRDGIEILRYPQRAASGLKGYVVEYIPSMLFTAAWLLWLRSRRPIAVIHGCNPPDLFFLLGIMGRAWGARYVYDQHDANPELSLAKWGGRRMGVLLHRLTLLLERASYRTAALVVVPNDSYARIARDRGKVPPVRLSVVRNAPPATVFATLAAGREPSTDGVFRIGYLGVMGSQDGVGWLVEAAAELASARPDLQFRVDLVGDGEKRPQLERLAAKLGVADRLVFHGYRQADYFVPLLATAHVCVCPDPPTPFNNVSTMTKVVEYLAIGRPAVIFDLEETRMLLGDAGLVIEEASPAALARALERLATDSELLRRLSYAAASRFGELDLAWEKSAAQLIEGYGRIAPVGTSSERGGRVSSLG